MSEHGDIPCRSVDSGDDPVDACGNLSRALAVRAAVAEDQPIGLPRPNLLRCEPLVVPVVPLAQIVLELHLRPEAGELARLPCSLQRAAQHQREGFRGRVRLPESRDTATVLGERNIRHTRMPPVQAPFRLAMPNQKDFLCRHEAFPRAAAG